MWYWTLPSMALTGACLLLPHYVYGLTNWIETGHGHRRNYEVDSRDYFSYLRDRRISGDEYRQIGLEGLDKPIDLSGLDRLFGGRERMAVPTKP